MRIDPLVRRESEDNYYQKSSNQPVLIINVASFMGFKPEMIRPTRIRRMTRMFPQSTFLSNLYQIYYTKKRFYYSLRSQISIKSAMALSEVRNRHPVSIV